MCHFGRFSNKGKSRFDGVYYFLVRKSSGTKRGTKDKESADPYSSAAAVDGRK